MKTLITAALAGAVLLASSAAQAGDVQVAVAANFTDTAKDIAAAFEKKTGNWGAFELVARYSTLDLNYHDTAAVAADRVLGGQQDISSLGLDWQLNPDVRFVFEGQSVKVERVNSAGLPLGQKYSAFAVRSQFNF